MEITREEVKQGILSYVNHLSLETIKDILCSTTFHDIYIMKYDDMNNKVSVDIAKMMRAMGEGIVFRTCQPYDDSCQYFYYDDTVGVARTAWEVGEFIDNLEAFCYYIGHHPEFLKKLRMPSDLTFALLKYFGKGTTYTPPVYKKVDFDYFEKVGRHFGLDDEGIAKAKKLATIYTEEYKKTSHENDRVVSIALNMRAIENTLSTTKFGDAFSATNFDSEIEFHENGGFTWYYKGVPIEIE